jgi:hypothetical protein
MCGSVDAASCRIVFVGAIVLPVALGVAGQEDCNVGRRLCFCLTIVRKNACYAKA